MNKINNRNNIHTFNIAIGNKTGHVIFSNIRSDTMNSVKLESSDGIQIPIKKLDDLPISETSISLIKIDVEGYEKFVLDGAPKMHKIPVILVKKYPNFQNFHIFLAYFMCLREETVSTSTLPPPG